MRILRLSLRNYRGIDACEIELAPRGVTIVEGPNEIGKSSLAEAIDVVFDELDSTAKARVKAIQPVHRDAGASVEIEVETGPYAFVYRKRFHRDRETRLRVSRPAPENLVGREAHERVRAILEETLDRDLWRAVRIQQGDGLEQAPLGGAASLARALERAAGGAGDDAAEETLFGAARAELARYYTETGRERREIANALAEAERARAEADEARSRLAALERDVIRADELARRIAELERREALGSETLRAREACRVALEAQGAELANLEARRDAARAKHETARREREQRQALAAELARADEQRRAAEEEIAAGEPGRIRAADERAQVESALRRAREAALAARALETARRRDRDTRRAERDVSALEARRTAVLASVAAARDAERVLETSRIDEDLVQAIHDAQLAAERARARLDSGGPAVHLEARAALELTLDGRLLRLRPGERLDATIADGLQLDVPGALDLVVTAGASTASLGKSLDEARTRLRALCAEAGVEDPADAVRANALHREAERALRERDRALAETPLEEIDADIAALRRTMTAQLESREAGSPLAPDLEAAEEDLASAESETQRAEAALAAAQSRADAVRRSAAELEAARRESEARLAFGLEGVARASAALARARDQVPDAELDAQCRALSARATALDAEVALRAGRLAEARPDRAVAAEGTARAALERVRRDLRRAREERIALEASLKERGDAGLFEAAEGREMRARHLERRLASLRRRAAAARLLHGELAAERDAARRGYAGPLREKIEELGRLVFGAGFSVELAEDLSIARRTLDGVTLDWDQLSAGAREQLALVARLACAAIAAPEGGVPVLLDDALGHTDPRRLEGMGAVLAAAAEHSQIAVLTCVPDRYRHVVGARVVRLG